MNRSTPGRIVIAVLTLGTASGCATGIAARGTGGDALAGTWTGYWTQSGDSLPVTMQITADTAGALRGSFTSERLRADMPFDAIERHGCCSARATLKEDATTSVFDLKASGDSITGPLTEGGNTGRVAVARVAAAPPAVNEVPIEFRNAKVALHGTLFVPRAAGRHPAAVMMPGSDSEDRATNRFLALALARDGIAALTYDKRAPGTASPTGHVAGVVDYVGDAIAGISAIDERPDIDPARIGVFAQGETATIVPMVAERNAALAYLVAAAPYGVPNDSLTTGVSIYFPPAHWQAVNPPVLLAFGTADKAVPVEASEKTIGAALHRDTPRLFTTCTYAGADHAMNAPRAGDHWLRSAPGYVDDVVKWIRVATRLDAAPPKLSAACH